MFDSPNWHLVTIAVVVGGEFVLTEASQSLKLSLTQTGLETLRSSSAGSFVDNE